MQQNSTFEIGRDIVIVNSRNTFFSVLKGTMQSVLCWDKDKKLNLIFRHNMRMTEKCSNKKV